MGVEFTEQDKRPWNKPIAVSQESETLRRQRETWSRMRDVLWVLQWCTYVQTSQRGVDLYSVDFGAMLSHETLLQGILMRRWAEMCQVFDWCAVASSCAEVRRDA